MAKEKNIFENPKKSPEILAWKEQVVQKYRGLGVDISADEEFFTLNLKDKNKRPYQIKIHAWDRIPLAKDDGPQAEDEAEKGVKKNGIEVEKVIETEVKFAPEYEFGEDRPSTKELLDRFSL